MTQRLSIDAVRDLWIGDRIVHAPSGMQGTFEGMEGEQIILNGANGSTHFPIAECMVLAEEDNKDTLEQSFVSPKSQREASSSINLHIEALDPTRVNDEPVVLRQYQIRRCKEFLEAAMEQGLTEVIIIHGRGEGVLESDVLSVVAKLIPTAHLEQIHNGGAHRVLL